MIIDLKISDLKVSIDLIWLLMSGAIFISEDLVLQKHENYVLVISANLFNESKVLKPWLLCDHHQQFHTFVWQLVVRLTIRLVASQVRKSQASLYSNHHQFSLLGHSLVTPYWTLLCHCHICHNYCIVTVHLVIFIIMTYVTGPGIVTCVAIITLSPSTQWASSISSSSPSLLPFTALDTICHLHHHDIHGCL